VSLTRTVTLAKSVQEAVAAYLGERHEFVGVPVVSIRKNNVAADLAAALSRVGVCLYVFPALPVKVNANSTGPYVDRLEVRVRAIEHPTLNLKGPDAYELVELLLRALDAKQLTAVEGLQPLFFEASPVQPVQDNEDLIQFDVVAYSSCGLEPRTSP
jgi:hypothetical protein